MKSFKTAFLAMAVVTAMTAAATTSALAAPVYDQDANVVSGYDTPDYTTGNQYTVLLVKQDDGETTEGATAATEDNIYYIDQAEDGTFTVKPKNDDTDTGLSAGTYEIRIGGEGVDTPVISVFTIGTEPVDEYTLGDVTDDGRINSTDATVILNYAAKAGTLTDTQLLAAEVSGDGKVTSIDATFILNYAVKAITSFPAESN